MDTAADRQSIINRYHSIRKFSLELCKTLEIEDFVIQSMPDVSPTKWHLAHTTWFFETFVLSQFKSNYKTFQELYHYLFNSYYVQAGERWLRPKRGMLSRPTVKDIFDYREYVDEIMLEFLNNITDKDFGKVNSLIEIGLNHEQQHQELILTDIKHVLSQNPLHPVYYKKEIIENNNINDIKFVNLDEGIYETGYAGDNFFYDNEKPVHKEYLNNFKFANRLVTNKEYIDFIEDDGYSNAILWLSDGFADVKKNKWNAPLYWEKVDGEWWNFTLNGFCKVNLSEPVCHVSFYEAEAFARWAGYRLPTEVEWEAASKGIEYAGNFVESKNYHPISGNLNDLGINQIFGDVWEWTRSEYSPYPGYKIPEGAIGEYNGKFMSNQMVLRGGSCATSITHIRNTYRNFFYHSSRWQFMGIRLAQDV